MARAIAMVVGGVVAAVVALLVLAPAGAGLVAASAGPLALIVAAGVGLLVLVAVRRRDQDVDRRHLPQAHPAPPADETRQEDQ